MKKNLLQVGGETMLKPTHLGDGVGGPDDHLVDAPVGQHGEGPLVQVHDGIVVALVPVSRQKSFFTSN